MCTDVSAHVCFNLCLSGQSPEAYGSHRVCLSVCLCVCVILQRAFFGNGKELSNESCNATIQLDILPLLNWLDFCFKALLSSYSVMCSPWRPLSAIESPVKSKLTTTNYLSSWKLHLYYKIDGDPSEILRTSTSKHSSLGPGALHATLMMVLVRHTPKLCTC